jgi:AcrR family transcriptional regulator
LGRKRVIEPERILDAAEAVVGRQGAAQLTIDAVAAEAGIGKASLLYHYRSKHALIAAVIDRAVRNDNAFNEAKTRNIGQTASAVIRGRIAAAAAPLPEEFRAVALHLCAALAQDETLRAAIQDNQRKVISSIAGTSAQPRGALLAYLALEGLKLLESLDYYSWPPKERTKILRDISWLVDQSPAPKKPTAAKRSSARDLS